MVVSRLKDRRTALIPCVVIEVGIFYVYTPYYSGVGYCIVYFSQGLTTTSYLIDESAPRLNRNLKFIILIISNAITGILCIGTVKFPLFLFFKRQNSVRSTILFRFTEKIETPIRKAVSYKEVAFLLPLQNIFPWLTNKLLGNLLFI